MHAVWLGIAVALLAVPAQARAQDDPPVPRDPVAPVPGEAPVDSAADSPDGAETPAEEEATVEPSNAAERQEREGSLLGARIQVDDDGTEWLTVSIPAQGRPALLVGLGYELGLESDDRLGHFLVQLGYGWTVVGRWTSARARGRMPRVYGWALYAHVVAGVGIPVEQDATPTQGLAGVRLSPVLARGRHAITAALSGGMRWDFSDSVGAQLAFGLGYSLILPPAAIPIVVEVVREWEGAFAGNAEWGLRLWLVSPLGL